MPSILIETKISNTLIVAEYIFIPLFQISQYTFSK